MPMPANPEVEDNVTSNETTQNPSAGAESSTPSETPTVQAFQKHNFRSGQILTASALNEIENEISRLGSEGTGSGGDCNFILDVEPNEDDGIDVTLAQAKSLYDAYNDGKNVFLNIKLTSDYGFKSSYIYQLIDVTDFFSEDSNSEDSGVTAQSMEDVSNTEYQYGTEYNLTFSSIDSTIDIYVEDGEVETLIRYGIIPSIAKYVYSPGTLGPSSEKAYFHNVNPYYNTSILKLSGDCNTLSVRFSTVLAYEKEKYELLIYLSGHNVGDMTFTFNGNEVEKVYGGYSSSNDIGVIRVTYHMLENEDGFVIIDDYSTSMAQ